jgi:hypothetical protein
VRSGAIDLLSPRVRRSIERFGADVSLARRKRGLTELMMAERVGVWRGTYQRPGKGDPTVAMGVYAMTLFVLGLGTPFAQLADPGHDDVGLGLDAQRVPKRVRSRRTEPKAT